LQTGPVMVHNEFGFLENSDEAEVVCPKIEKLV
jgi:hypothetical protein